MLRNFQGRSTRAGITIWGRFFTELDYAVIVKIDTFKVLRDKAGLSTGDDLPLKRLGAWVEEREKPDLRARRA